MFFWPITLGLALSIFYGCNQRTQKQTSPPEPSLPVILSFDIFNHTQGYLSRSKREARSGERVVLKIKDLGVGGVDKGRIVIREERFGALRVFSKTGAAVLEAPRENRKYTVYLMNASNGADYRLVDTWTGANEGVLEYAPPIKWFRENRDGYQGPDDVIQDTIDLLNDALSYDWATYGNLVRIEHRTNGSFGIGYGYCRNQFGWHNPYWAGINPEYCTTTKERCATFLEEIFELLTRLNDIGGRDTASLIADPDSGGLNERGKDLLAYVFVKDVKI
jgi:hypothetical protein